MKYIAPAVINVHDALNLIQGGKGQGFADSNMVNHTTSAAYESDE